MKTIVIATVILVSGVTAIVSSAQTDVPKVVVSGSDIPKVILSDGAYATMAGPSRTFPDVSVAHNTYTADFASKPGFGSGRVMFLPPQDLAIVDGEVYRFNSPDLIGLENDPVVYQRSGGVINLSVDVMSKKEVRERLTKRPLTTVESDAVGELRAGKDLLVYPEQFAALQPSDRIGESKGVVKFAKGKELSVIEGPAITHVAGLRAIGSLRAQPNCAHCHGVNEGTLLGAFSYSLVPTNEVAAVISTTLKPIDPPKPPATSPSSPTNQNVTMSDQFNTVPAFRLASASGR